MPTEPQVKLLEFGSPEQQRSIDLRRRALRIPLGLEFSPADLAKESSELHFGAFVGGELVGVLLFRALPAPGLLKMRQVAVDESYRSQGIGAALVRFAEGEAEVRGYCEIELHAREEACRFYERLGYARQGERFLEVGIPHFKMRKRLVP